MTGVQTCALPICLLVSRRTFLLASAGLALTTIVRPGRAGAVAAGEYRIVAAPGDAPLRGANRSKTGVWAYVRIPTKSPGHSDLMAPRIPT